MTLAEFKRCVSNSTPPSGMSAALTALWWAAKNDWDRAHNLVMDEGGDDCARVHAYLHRLEGDLANAAYWYRQARQPVATGALETEWVAIADALLSKEHGDQ